MRVALIAPEKLPVPPIRGGAVEIYIFELARRLCREHLVTVFCPQDPDLPDQEESSYLSYQRLPNKTAAQYIEAVIQQVAGGRFDLVHVFNRPQFVLFLATRLQKTKIILNLHNDHLTIEAGRALAGGCIEQFAGIITNCRFLSRQVVVKAPEFIARSKVIYSGVDTDWYRPVWERQLERSEHRRKMNLEGKRVVLFAGRLIANKGVHILIQALKPLMHSDPDLVLMIAGSPWFSDPTPTAYTRKLFQLAQTIKRQVIFTGFVPPDQMPMIYLMADLFVCPSQWKEPLARVNMEAMASGIPVLASASGGIPEIVLHGETGLLVKKYNDPASFKKSIEFLFANPEFAREMARKGRRHVERYFSWERVAKEMLDFYKQIEGR